MTCAIQSQTYEFPLRLAEGAKTSTRDLLGEEDSEVSEVTEGGFTTEAQRTQRFLWVLDEDALFRRVPASRGLPAAINPYAATTNRPN